MLTFEELTEARRTLQGFCLRHVPSLMLLQSGISFKLEPTEKKLSDEEVEHMTTSATCWTSLFDCPSRYRITDGEDNEISDLRDAFASKALLRPGSEWKSEKSAAIYCRCRALPTIIRAATVNKLDEALQSHLATILRQLKRQPDRFGIGEADPKSEEKYWYPPNAYHTYWTLEILELLQEKFPADYERLKVPAILDLKRRRDGMVLWARQRLGYQLGLHSSSPQSSLLDSDQLAWSLAIFLRFDESLSVNLENRDFIKQALKCLFSTQFDGTWRHYKPLFHYEAVGNAYCYVFETFAVLLHCALRNGSEPGMVRELLEPYCKNLLDLWRHADSTKISLFRYRDLMEKKPSSGDIEVGWSSGHRINFLYPETWATASVFSYTQALRRLIGIWCREQAARSLIKPRSHLGQKEAAEEISSRGETWGSSQSPVSERLWTMFINPVRMHRCVDKLEPDSQPIEEKHSRSAILFGPPGTSKTTLVRSLADFVGWTYIEIHASDFVAEGLTQVQKTADRIFKQISELDHAIILFDEIDELVRERDMERDAFGRFLTTSMLPKLAELWEARKIIYFVATNHINYFDSAIIRSHRFDALVLVSPPSYQSKVRRITKLLADVHGLPGIPFEAKEKEILDELGLLQRDQEALPKPVIESAGMTIENAPATLWREQKLLRERTLAKFALLRFDELNELAYRLALVLKANPSTAKTISSEILRNALEKLADSEWRKNKSYVDYLRDTRSERRDYQMLNIWEVKGESEISAPDVREENGLKWLARAVDSLQDIQIPSFEIIPAPPGGAQVRSATHGNAKS